MLGRVHLDPEALQVAEVVVPARLDLVALHAVFLDALLPLRRVGLGAHRDDVHAGGRVADVAGAIGVLVRGHVQLEAGAVDALAIHVQVVVRRVGGGLLENVRGGVEGLVGRGGVGALLAGGVAHGVGRHGILVGWLRERVLGGKDIEMRSRKRTAAVLSCGISDLYIEVIGKLF